jgi:hypothetical protein
MGFHVNDIGLALIVGRHPGPPQGIYLALVPIATVCKRKQFRVAHHWSLAGGN